MPDYESITPKNNFYLLGQEEAEKVMLEAYNTNTLHNSWLISGVKGIGKATLAYKFARFLLDEARKQDEFTILSSTSEALPEISLPEETNVYNSPVSKGLATSLFTNPDSHVNRLINNNAHPDFKIIERDFIETDRRKVIKAIKDGDAMDDAELKNLKKSAFIRIDDVRSINEFMSKKSSDGGWRVVIIDSIDDMNTASANALLKILEEPPAKSILLLISHNIGQLLPTIKSRCTKLVLKPLDNNVICSLLRRYCSHLSEEEIKGLAEISAGSIGKAISYASQNALQMYKQLNSLISTGNTLKIDNLLTWVNLATESEESYDLACELILKFCSDNIITASNKEGIFSVWENAVKTFRQADSLNMDKKQVLINILNNLCKVI